MRGDDRARRRGPSRAAGILVSVAVIVVVFALVLPKIASYGAVWDVARGLRAQMAVALLLAAALNVLSFAPPWMVTLPGLGFLNAVRVTQASTALSLVAPGGPAVGITTRIAMLGSWGLPARAMALAVGLVGLASQLAIYGLPVVALVVLSGSGRRNGQLDLVAAIGLAVLALIVVGSALPLSSGRVAHWIGEVAARVASAMTGLVRGAPLRWGGASGWSRLPLSGILVGFGADNDAAVAGVLIYRVLQFAPTLGVGLLAGATWRRGAPRP